MDLLTLVREAARSQQLLDDKGALKRLDSLTIIDFVVELERVVGFEIPSLELRNESFESIETVAALLTELRDG